MANKMRYLSFFYNPLKKTYQIAIISMLAYLVNFVINLYLAHSLSTRYYGEFSVGIAFLTILTTISLLGTNITSKQHLRYYLAQKDKSGLQQFIHLNLRTVEVSYLITMFISLGILLLIMLLHFFKIKNIHQYHLFIYILIITPTSSLFYLIGSYISTLGHSVFYKFLQKTKLLFMCLFIYAGTSIYLINPDTFFLATIIFLAFAILVTTETFFIRVYFPGFFKTLTEAIQAQKIKKNIYPSKTSLLFTANNIIGLCIHHTGLFLLMFLSHQTSNVGIYAAILIITSSLLVLPENIYTDVQTKLYDLLQQPNGIKKISEIYKKINRLILFFSLTITIFIFTFSKQLLQFFGNDFIAYSLALKVQTIAWCFTAFSYPYINLLTYSNRPEVLLKIRVAVLLTIIGLGLILFQLFGITGIALSYCIPYFFSLIYAYIKTYQLLKFKAFLI